MTIVEQILLILDYIHLRGIIIHEINPDNILINNFSTNRQELEVLISDLNSVKLLSSSDAKIISSLLCDSPRFMKPEVKSGDESTPQYDIIQAGILF